MRRRRWLLGASLTVSGVALTFLGTRLILKQRPKNIDVDNLQED
jgi:hypothetical protein